MDISRLRKKDIKAWLPVEEGVEVLCRHITQSQWEAARDEATEETFHPATGTTERKFDQHKFRALVARLVVEDVRGLTDGEDEGGRAHPFVCSPENLDWLMEEWTEFRLAVMGAPTSLKRMLALAQEQERKNS